MTINNVYVWLFQAFELHYGALGKTLENIFGVKLRWRIVIILRLWEENWEYNQLKRTHPSEKSEAESKEKHCVWDPMPELTITSPYVQSRVNSNTFTISNPMPLWVDLNPMPESTLYPSKGLWIWPQGYKPSIDAKSASQPSEEKTGLPLTEVDCSHQQPWEKTGQHQPSTMAARHHVRRQGYKSPSG